MYTISIIACCPDEYAEVLPDALDCAACLVEEQVGLVLLELFGMVRIDVVSVTHSTSEDIGGGHLDGCDLKN